MDTGAKVLESTTAVGAGRIGNGLSPVWRKRLARANRVRPHNLKSRWRRWRLCSMTPHGACELLISPPSEMSMRLNAEVPSEGGRCVDLAVLGGVAARHTNFDS